MKQRIVGVVVIVALAVIFIPIIFKGSDNLVQTSELSGNVPSAPAKPRVDLKLPASVPTPPRTAPSPQAVQRIPVTKAKPIKIVSKPIQLVKPKPKVITVAKPEAWTVQLGSFSDKANVNRLIKDLRAKGLPAYVKTTTIKNKKIMRVLVGPEIKRTKAEALLATLQKTFKLKGIIIRYTA